MYPSPERAVRHLSAALVFLAAGCVKLMRQTPGIKIVVCRRSGGAIKQHTTAPREKKPVVQVTEDQKPVQGASVTFILPDDGPERASSGNGRANDDDPGPTKKGTSGRARPTAKPDPRGRLQIRVTASFSRAKPPAPWISQINAEPAGATSGGKWKEIF